MAALRLLLVYLVVFMRWQGVLCTNPQDASALRSLKDQWQNVPPNWRRADDPCKGQWEGVTCSGPRVTALGLSSMDLSGKLSGDIGQLTELTSLDLSFNPRLSGSISPKIGALTKLTTLILAGCSFSGSIPSELGNLSQLSFLALNSNNFSGEIPPSLGNIDELYWLDLADNQLTGSFPVSTPSSPGLDLLKKTKHFHFNKNQLSGPLPEKLFSGNNVLIHVLFDGNQLSGPIPPTLGDIKTLEVLRLDRNNFSGPVPARLNNLTNLMELNLAHNQLSGVYPDFSRLTSLNYVDLSNNSFDPSESPAWFSTLQSLTTLISENGSLEGLVPEKLFSLSQIEQVNLRKNAFKGTLDLGNGISQSLQLIDLEDNDITSMTVSSGYSNNLLLIGNPVCTTAQALQHSSYCQVLEDTTPPYSTSLANCRKRSCKSDQKISPQSCACAYPYRGTMYFRAPSFRDISNDTLFHELEMSLWVKLNLTPGSVSLQDPFFSVEDYLQVQLDLFPSDGDHFNRSEIQRIGFALTKQLFKPPPLFGPYYFLADTYLFAGDRGGLSKKVIITVALGCTFLVLLLVGLGLYAAWQKRRAERAIGLSKPFASWVPSGKESGGAPQLKGARWFSYDEMKKATNNFSDSNAIGSGGYGKVYRGLLPNGQVVAVKRSEKGSMQGGLEFKTEIELLSRVHHKNLVSLVGFCFEQGEQMLVYEFMPNGTLRESLSGKSGIFLDWKRRLRIALGSARGLTYLHELADPPIIHRDVKSTNILLDENLTAKVADFGLSKLVSDASKGHVSTQVKGTLGYLDPEYYMTQQLTEKSDVYSFGVVMLELVTARQPIEKGKYIVREVRLALDKTDEECLGLGTMMDPTIRTMAANLVGFEKFVDLALQCVEESAADRPTTGELVKQIELILQNDGLNTNSTSATSSATDFGNGVGKHHLYDNMPAKKDGNGNNSDSGAFEYSGGYSFSAKVQPK